MKLHVTRIIDEVDGHQTGASQKGALLFLGVPQNLAINLLSLLYEQRIL